MTMMEHVCRSKTPGIMAKLFPQFSMNYSLSQISNHFQATMLCYEVVECNDIIKTKAIHFSKKPGG